MSVQRENSHRELVVAAGSNVSGRTPVLLGAKQDESKELAANEAS
jgi:hypothetical protein